jgi:hypothetical protein
LARGASGGDPFGVLAVGLMLAGGGFIGNGIDGHRLVSCLLLKDLASFIPA